MPIHLLDHHHRFPPAHLADEDTGILAVGGDLHPERVLLAYRSGIFPWYDENSSPILWHAPAWRMVLDPARLHVGRSLRKQARRRPYRITWNTAFDTVVAACARSPRPRQAGTWLNARMRACYAELHAAGHAHSAEAWHEDELVGGLYGVTVGGAFFGESMFARAPDASKLTFVATVEALAGLGYRLVDCQIYTEHLARFGAVEWPRARFQAALAEAVAAQPHRAWPAA